MEELYTTEKLLAGVSSLATGMNRINVRLESAVISHLIHVNEAALPEGAREPFAEAMAAVTAREPVGCEGSIRASIEAMGEDEASRVAGLFVGAAWAFLRISRERAEAHAAALT